jgi:hypothetical protein
VLITMECIMALRSKNAGWSRKVVEGLGGIWPTCTGWREGLVGLQVDDAVYAELLACKDDHLLKALKHAEDTVARLKPILKSKEEEMLPNLHLSFAQWLRKKRLGKKARRINPAFYEDHPARHSNEEFDKLVDLPRDPPAARMDGGKP